MLQPNKTQARYVQLPELIDMFKGAPSFISKKAFKAIPLSENGELMVEAQITEHMAAGLATAAQEVQEGQYALIHSDNAYKVLPYLTEKGAVSPDDLLNNYIEVMDVCNEDFLRNEAIIDGTLGAFDTNVYTDPPLDVVIVNEDMNIPSFMDPYGVELIYKGQLLVRNSVLGVFPYQRPHHSITHDITFIEHHIPLNEENQLVHIESSQRHQAIEQVLLNQNNARNNPVSGEMTHSA